jgi:hypothetical protein
MLSLKTNHNRLNTGKLTSTAWLLIIPHLAKPTNLNKYRVHNTVEFLCDVGYILSGSKSAMCRYVDGDNMGSWDNQQPSCTGKLTSIQSIMISFQRKHNIS